MIVNTKLRVELSQGFNTKIVYTQVPLFNGQYVCKRYPTRLMITFGVNPTTDTVAKIPRWLYNVLASLGCRQQFLGCEWFDLFKKCYFGSDAYIYIA